MQFNQICPALKWRIKKKKKKKEAVRLTHSHVRIGFSAILWVILIWLVWEWHIGVGVIIHTGVSSAIHVTVVGSLRLHCVPFICVQGWAYKISMTSRTCKCPSALGSPPFHITHTHTHTDQEEVLLQFNTFSKNSWSSLNIILQFSNHSFISIHKYEEIFSDLNFRSPFTDELLYILLK